MLAKYKQNISNKYVPKQQQTTNKIRAKHSQTADMIQQITSKIPLSYLANAGKKYYRNVCEIPAKY